MTVVQDVLHNLKQGIKINNNIECFETKDMNNGYYKLCLVNGRYSYVTNENFQKIQPYISYKEREYKNPVEKLTKNILSCIEYYKADLDLLNQNAV